MKKGQVTLFVILGIVILLSVVLVFMLRNKLDGLPSFGKQEFTDVEAFLRDCTRNNLVDGMYSVSMQGGYYRPGKEKSTVSYLKYQIPLYLTPMRQELPLLENVETEMGRYVADKTELCLSEIEKNGAYRIIRGTPQALVTIAEKKVMVTVNPSLEIERDNKTRRFGQVKEEIVFDLPKKYNIVKMVLDEQEKERNAAQLGFLSALSSDEKFLFDVVPINNKTLVYILFFNETLKRGEDYRWAFAVEYDWE